MYMYVPLYFASFASYLDSFVPSFASSSSDSLLEYHHLSLNPMNLIPPSELVCFHSKPEVNLEIRQTGSYLHFWRLVVFDDTSYLRQVFLSFRKFRFLDRFDVQLHLELSQLFLCVPRYDSYIMTHMTNMIHYLHHVNCKTWSGE